MMPLPQLRKMGSKPIYLQHRCRSCSSVNTHIESNAAHLVAVKKSQLRPHHVNGLSVILCLYLLRPRRTWLLVNKPTKVLNESTHQILSQMVLQVAGIVSTHHHENTPWWTVDLDDGYQIAGVVVANRRYELGQSVRYTNFAI